MNPAKTFFYAWREMLTGKRMPDHDEPDIANVPLPRACGKCSHRLPGEKPGPMIDWCDTRHLACELANTDGTCPDFKQRPAQFNYLTGEWMA